MASLIDANLTDSRTQFMLDFRRFKRIGQKFHLDPLCRVHCRVDPAQCATKSGTQKRLLRETFAWHRRVESAKMNALKPLKPKKLVDERQLRNGLNLPVLDDVFSI